MMIIDAHSHLGTKEHLPPIFLEEMFRPFFRAKGTTVPSEILGGIDPATFIKDHDIASVHKSCIFSFIGNETEIAGYKMGMSNDYIARIAQEYPDKLIPIASVNPYRGALATEELERAIIQLGMKGLKLYPTFEE